MKRLISLLLCCFILFFLAGCVKVIKLAPLENINFIQKNYPQVGEINDLSFSYAEPHLTIEGDITAEFLNGLQARMKYNAQNLACYLNGELDKILLSKGFTITDRFRNHRYMTYSEKRNTTALFYPDIKIHILENSEIEGSSPTRMTTAGMLQIRAEINIIMLEPLSEEIIWIKSIPVEDINESFEYQNAFWAGFDGQMMKKNVQFFKVGRGQKRNVPENLVDIGKQLDNYLEKIALKITEATLRFVDPEEFKFLNTDIIKIKKIKRY